VLRAAESHWSDLNRRPLGFKHLPNCPTVAQCPNLAAPFPQRQTQEIGKIPPRNCHQTAMTVVSREARDTVSTHTRRPCTRDLVQLDGWLYRLAAEAVAPIPGFWLGRDDGPVLCERFLPRSSWRLVWNASAARQDRACRVGCHPRLWPTLRPPNHAAKCASNSDRRRGSSAEREMKTPIPSRLIAPTMGMTYSRSGRRVPRCRKLG